jgi:hypothetical protein
MAAKSKVINRIELVKGRNYLAHIDPKTNELVLEEETPEPEWTDITRACNIESVMSTHDGLFNKLMYYDTCIAYFSPLDAAFKQKDKFKVEIATNASLSVKVFIKTDYLKGKA